MTCRYKDSILNEILELVTEDGFDGMAEAVRLLINLVRPCWFTRATMAPEASSYFCHHLLKDCWL